MNLAKLSTLSASFNFPRSFRHRATLDNAKIVSSETLKMIKLFRFVNLSLHL